MTIEKTEELTEEYGELMDEQFNMFAEKNGLVCDYTPFVFVAKENGKAAGFITGHAYYNEVHISDLIVLEEYRKTGVGTMLIRTVEDSFRGKGYENINLSTYEFQAKGFYEKCGYTLEFTRENPANEKLTKYFFVKYY